MTLNELNKFFEQDGLDKDKELVFYVDCGDSLTVDVVKCCSELYIYVYLTGC